jgi:hypothetical protein
MAKLDQDTRILYTLIAKHGSDWVKKRLTPKEAAQFALDAHFNVTRAPQAVLPESWRAHPAQRAMLQNENPFLDNVTFTEDDGEPQ